MQLFFLSAGQPIAKRYELDSNGNIVKHAYPFIYEVTSHRADPPDLGALATLMQHHAAQGHCLVKGTLGRDLVAESRKGSTNPDDKTDWVCLDLDGIENYQSVDLFLDDIGCSDVDHIVQWSSSMGIENKAGFRCHVFMRLDHPVHPELLKQWLMHLNLSTGRLNAQLQLTKTGNALRWPLDVTTCQNDKLLYIAPPLLGPGIADPFPGVQRITHQKRSKTFLHLPATIPSRDALRAATDTRIAELRASANLPKRKASKFKFSGTTEYLVSPDTATVTEMKTERGFVYFNLNGGDSWAYYHPEDNPAFIYNFKGEPTYRTEDLLPAYWATLQQKAQSYQPNAQGLIYLAFRDFKTSNYYNGWFDTATNELKLAQAKTETQLRHFTKQHGVVLGETIPDWDIAWNPHTSQVVDVKARTVNLYQASPYYTQTAYPVTTAPPTIMKVISHVLNHDVPTINHFMNWLACIVQHRTRTGTAWVWQGTQGTGKGVLMHSILSPILGEANVVSKRMEELESEFTGFMENKFIVFIDEIESGKSLYHSRITAKLKNLIVEPLISIRRMHTLPYMAPNFSNMIFASNKPAPIEVAPDDRRFNVGPYQNSPIVLTSKEVDIDIPAELPDFFQFLMAYNADQDIARKPLVSSARQTLITISRTAIDLIADAILSGDLAFLWDHLPTQTITNPLLNLKYQPFKQLMIQFVNTPPAALSRDDLFTLFEWCVGNMPTSPHKFTSLLKHHRIHLRQIWFQGRNVKGLPVTWNIDPTWHASVLQEIANGLIV